MISKYAGRCRTCGDEYEKGEEIYWTRDDGAHHLECKRPSIAESPKTDESIELAGRLGFLDAKKLDD